MILIMSETAVVEVRPVSFMPGYQRGYCAYQKHSIREEKNNDVSGKIE
jgi:hypothetical protein